MRYFLVIVSVLFFSCKKKDIILKYSEYSSDNVLKKQNSVIQTYKQLDDGESILSIVGNNNYRKTLLVRKIGEKLYWKCRDKFFLSHSLYYGDKLRSCFQSPPFLNRYVRLNKSKIYVYRNKRYFVYRFGESNGSESSIETYYLKGIGFICYYDLLKYNYYFLSDISGVNDLNGSDIKWLQNTITNDSSFFAAYWPKVDSVKWPISSKYRTNR